MSKQIILILLLIAATYSYAVEPNFTNTSKHELETVIVTENYFQSSTEYELSLMNLQVDVMGFLLFGPQISFDFQFANIVAVGPFVRWNYAGVVYQGVITDWFSEETTVSPASYGIGIQAKALIPVGTGHMQGFLMNVLMAKRHIQEALLTTFGNIKLM